MSETIRTTSSAVTAARGRPSWAPLVVGLLAGPGEDADRLGRELVVQDIVGGQRHGLADRVRLDRHPVTVGQPDRKMGGQPAGGGCVRLRHLDPAKQVGELGIVGRHLLVLARGDQPDQPAPGAGESLLEGRLVRPAPVGP
jgi:hypothetical protein